MPRSAHRSLVLACVASARACAGDHTAGDSTARGEDEDEDSADEVSACEPSKAKCAELGSERPARSSELAATEGESCVRWRDQPDQCGDPCC